MAVGGGMTKVDDNPVVGCEGICTGILIVEVEVVLASFRGSEPVQHGYVVLLTMVQAFGNEGTLFIKYKDFLTIGDPSTC